MSQGVPPIVFAFDPLTPARSDTLVMKRGG
jgi:hypothetical protein